MNYHVFRFPDGAVTPGIWDLTGVEANLSRSAAFLRGRTVLDVGCRDGWYAALFARMGAVPTCLDIEDRSARREAFERLGLDIPFLHENVYSLAFDEADGYDYVFSSDMLIHCEHPILAVRAMIHQARAGIILGVGLNEYNLIQRPDDRNSPFYGYNYIWRLTLENWINLFAVCGLKSPKELCRGRITSERWGPCDLVFLLYFARQEDHKMLDLDYVFPEEVHDAANLPEADPEADAAIGVTPPPAKATASWRRGRGR